MHPGPLSYQQIIEYRPLAKNSYLSDFSASASLPRNVLLWLRLQTMLRPFHDPPRGGSWAEGANRPCPSPKICSIWALSALADARQNLSYNDV